MKRMRNYFSLLLLSGVLLTAFSHLMGGTVKGTVNPADAGIKVMAVSGMDTAKANIINGAFEITNLSPGVYTLIVEAAAPYKNASVKSIKVTDGEVTDIGSIPLSK
jgi:hypothetical protein